MPSAPARPAVEDRADRQALLCLLRFLTAGFEWIGATPNSSNGLIAHWLDHWEDEEHIYLETKVPGDTSGLELDLHLHDGVIFARIAQRCQDADAPTMPSAAEIEGPGWGL